MMIKQTQNILKKILFVLFRYSINLKKMFFLSIEIYTRPRLLWTVCMPAEQNCSKFNSHISNHYIGALPEQFLGTKRWDLRTVSQTTGPLLCSTCNKTCLAQNFKTYSKFKNILPTLSMTQRGVFKHGHLC